MAQPLPPRTRAVFVVLLLALFPAFNGLQPRLDEDTWWHLAVGKYVVERQAVPATDPFSQIGQGDPVPWVAYSWLHEVALYGAFEAGGPTGVIAFRHLLDSLSFVVVATFLFRGDGTRGAVLLALGLVTAALVPMMLERPWHYTIAFTTLTLQAVLAMSDGASPRRHWWLVPIYALWANLHIQFVLGLGLLGLGLLVHSPWLANEHRRRWGGWAALAAACGLATLANPYHVRLYGVVWEYASQTEAMRLVAELSPPDFSLWWNWALAALLVWAGATCVERRLPVLETALLVIGAAFALRMQRDIWFGAVLAAAVVTRRPGTAPAPSESLRLVVVAGVAIGIAHAMWAIVPAAGPARANRDYYPAGAVEYLRKHRPDGPMVNHFNWGGYLIWALPEYPVSLDGRTNLYGEARLRAAFAMWAETDDWRRHPELQTAGFVIAPKDLGADAPPLTALLLADTDAWAAVYEDSRAAVLVRRRP